METAKVIESFGDMLGSTLTHIETSMNVITFTLDNDEQYMLYHEQDCCEQVCVEDVIGDWNDLLGLPLLMCEEVSNLEGFDGNPLYEDDKSYTWTFYKLATIKGYVTIRWYGSSNGYYSESVDFAKVGS